MARAIERIEKDIEILKQEVRAIATELHGNYISYLTVLGEVLQKQLVLATYHLCTQGYPESFMNLSLSQRQKLQQGIRQLGKKGGKQLFVYIQPPEIEGSEEIEPIEDLEEIDIEEMEMEDVETEDEEENIETEGEDIETEEKNIETEDIAKNENNKKYLDPSNPIEVLQWHQDLEEHIQDVLKLVSLQANSGLQKAGMLPKKLPQPILAAATAAASEASTEIMPGPPNILNLVIELSSEEDSEESSLTPLMTINLRLGDIEFSDQNLLSGRKQVRSILLQLNKKGKEYQKKYKELKIAEAEAAWRASWFED